MASTESGRALADAEIDEALGERGLVFFSHSSRIRDPDDPGHVHRKKFLQGLLAMVASKLAGMGFDVWYDKDDLRVSDDFDAVIYDALNICDLAVVMVDCEALTSHYVRREVTILMFRNTVEGLPVLPVLLGEVDDDAFRESHLARETGLARLLPLRRSAAKDNFKTAPQTADEICDRIAATEVPGLATDSLTGQWIETVKSCLAGVSDAHLWRAAKPLGAGADEWRRVRVKDRALAAALLSSPDEAAVHTAIREIHRLIPPYLRELAVEHALPLWVDLDLAREIRVGAVEQRTVGVATRPYRLARQVTQRATVSAPGYVIITLRDVAAETPVAERVRGHSATIRNSLGLSATQGPVAVAADLNKNYQGTFALLRCDTDDVDTSQAVVEQLQQAFPGIVFVLLGSATSGIWAHLWPRLWPHLPEPPAYHVLDDATELAARQYVSRLGALTGPSIPVDSDD